MNNLSVIHAWEINGFVKLYSDYSKNLEVKILQSFPSFRRLSILSGIDRQVISRIYQREGRGFVKTSTLFKFGEFLNIDKFELEKQIEFFQDSQAGAYNRVYRIDFPFVLSPLVIRLVSHMIGDGSVYKDHLRYSQQHVDYIKTLSEMLLNPPNRLLKTILFEKDRSFKEEAFNLPMFFGKCVCNHLKISRSRLGSCEFLKKSLSLPKEYRIQILAAIFVDEGSIESQTIRMKNKNIMNVICKLIDSLGYKKSELKQVEHVLKYNGKQYKVKMYGVRLWSQGFRDFLNDIKDCIKKHGILAGLWQKQDDLEKRVKEYSYEYQENRNKTRFLREQIISILKKEKNIRRSEIIKRFNANPDNIDYILKTLLRKKVIKRIGIGVYS